MGKPFVSAMSTVFGRKKETVSKSWSDMWDEDEEEEEREQQQLATLKEEMNSRTWSRESSKDMSKKVDKAEPVATSHVIKGNVDDDLVADGFFFHEATPVKQIISIAPRYSPPSKRSNLDKWAVLGERRRGLSQSMEQEKSPAFKQRRPIGIGYKSYEAGVWDHTNKSAWGKERLKDSPFNKAKDWNWRRDRRSDLGDIEWVGGW
ncbi:hypothetical protein PT974_02769 [Cladobotryum mycophilum]|uniref:Uncharacterized protein n=1 Tax=Cladobotryum mycophilum TaxID=491253 RepID=A0ABR0SZ61_9HYPO